MVYFDFISSKVGVSAKQIAATVALLNENATIPFIARYRKEKTGSLDEVQIAAIADEYHRYLEMEDRKATILNTIAEQGQLTDELKARMEKCWDATELEDSCLPYKPHRETRADVAREEGYDKALEGAEDRRCGDGLLTLAAEHHVDDHVAHADDAKTYSFHNQVPFFFLI